MKGLKGLQELEVLRLEMTVEMIVKAQEEM